MSLWSDFLLNNQRLIRKHKHYFPIYEQYFSKFVGQSLVFWEIGVADGGSLQMWKRYFGPFATIVGLDINPNCKKVEEDQIHVRIGDQSDTTFLQSVLDEFGPPDIVLDDGSHVMEHLWKSWSFLYDKISERGIYFLEDIGTSYWDSHGGGLKREGTFIERCKALIDDFRVKEGPFAASTYCISFYASIAVFEKKRRILKNTPSIVNKASLT